MKLVLQRISNAQVKVDGKVFASIGKGILVLAGFDKSDNENNIDKKISYLVNKIINLRIFEDNSGKMNKSVRDVNGEILVVSNFTLAASIEKGRRPSFENALKPEDANKYYNSFISMLEKNNIKVKKGKFKAHMEVLLTNDGPVTLCIQR